MSEDKKPTTLNDIIKPKRDSALYNSLNTEDRFRYLIIYVQESKKLHPHNHKEIIDRTDKEFSSKH
jgi:hypothetical protein|tara:strand:+ start:207 stop:404 length:198 start_codon:yes stop_codon:yes gene_type:complete